jgi:hypothetical protein
MLPKDDLAKQPVLSRIAQTFEERVYSEDEVNDLIRELDDDDHVLIRRELVNFGYLSKDAYAGTYRVLKRSLSPQELERIGARQSRIATFDDE